MRVNSASKWHTAVYRQHSAKLKKGKYDITDNLIYLYHSSFCRIGTCDKKDAKKAKDFVVTTDGILLFIAFLSIVCMMIDDMVFKNDLFGSPVMNIALLTFLGSIALILLFTVALIIKMSVAKR